MCVEIIEQYNKNEVENFNIDFDFLQNKLTKTGANVTEIVNKIADFNCFC